MLVQAAVTAISLTIANFIWEGGVWIFKRQFNLQKALEHSFFQATAILVFVFALARQGIQ